MQDNTQIFDTQARLQCNQFHEVDSSMFTLYKTATFLPEGAGLIFCFLVISASVVKAVKVYSLGLSGHETLCATHRLVEDYIEGLKIPACLGQNMPKYAKSESLRPGLANSAGPSASSCDWQPLATASFLSEASSQLGKDGYNTSPPLPGIMSHLEIE